MKEHEQTLVEYQLTEAGESLAEAKVLLREKMLTATDFLYTVECFLSKKDT